MPPKGWKKQKRIDPEDAPVNGDYGKDKIQNPQPGIRYAMLSDEDVPTFRNMGYVKSERRPDRLDKPAWDLGDEADSGYKVGNLTQYECKEELLAARERMNIKRQDQRMASIKANARRTGGDMTQELQ